MAGTGIMKDSYVGGIISSSFIQHAAEDSPFCVHSKIEEQTTHTAATGENEDSILFGGKTSGWDLRRSNQTDEDKIIHLTCTDEAKSTNINKTEEYNVGYTGLSILPWEEFVFNPRTLNELFFTESNQKITYDPDEVNVFFHGRNVMPPTIGDISENGKSWNIEVDTVNDLRKVRTLLTTRCSVFGVTLQYREKRFSKPVRAPCVVLLDPNQDGIGDRLYTILTKAMDTVHSRRRMCVEINLNACVERWCRRVMLTECKAVGAKLVVTNGEEYTSSTGAEDVVCCVVCFPIWLLQTGIYKLHRHVTYDDYRMDFGADDMFLHGSHQDIQYQRHQIFKEDGEEVYFRVRSAIQTDTKTLQALGTHKFVSVKEPEITDNEIKNKQGKAHNVTPFGYIIDKRKVKVMEKDKKISEKMRSSKNFNSNSSSPQLEEKFKIEGAVKHATGDENVKDCASYSDNKQNENDDDSMVFYNNGFESSHDESDESVAQSIPEITSVLCAHDEEETAGFEIPEDIGQRNKIGKNNNLMSTYSLDQKALEYKMYGRSKRNNGDGKSLTAVCSFEVLDTESESESDTGDARIEDGNRVSKRKKDLINEVLKIDKTLPALQKEPMVKNVDELNTEEKDKQNKERSKAKHKPKAGKVLKELFKTTGALERQGTLPSTKDERFQENKRQTSDKSNKCTKITDDTKINENANKSSAKNSTKEKGKTGKDDTLGQAPASKLNDDHNKKTNRAEILYSKRAPGKSQETVISSLNEELSSSDGDDVEMIYQSPKPKFEATNIEEFSYYESSIPKTRNEEQSTHKTDRALGANPIEINKGYDVKTNFPADLKSKLQKDSFPNKTTASTCGKNLSENQTVLILEDEQISDTVEHRNTLFGVKKVESALDITDIEDTFEDNSNDKPKVKIPPLRLKIGEALGKKALRSNKRNNSSGKYLGIAMNAKRK